MRINRIIKSIMKYILKILLFLIICDACKRSDIDVFDIVEEITDYDSVYSDKNDVFNRITDMAILDSVLITKHMNDTYHFSFIDDKETREDIVSDVFTSLWDKIDSFDFQSDTALGYIKMCVKNSCLNYLKHQEYEWNYAEVVQKKAPIYEVEPDSVYTLDELYRMLYETLNKLPESYRTVFIKSFFEGKTHTEIAEEMNLSVKSINRYKQKTMELMRNELKDYLPLFLLLFAKI